MSRRKHQRRGRATRQRCTICSRRDLIEQHHVGGRNHARWFTLPVCQRHHREITTVLHASGVQMQHTTNKIHRLAHALKSLAVFLFQLADELLK